MVDPKLTYLEKASEPHHLVAVAENWFTSAFGLAFGESITEVLEQIHAELACICVTLADESENEANAIEALHRLRYRIGVGHEWSKRLDRLAELERGPR